MQREGRLIRQGNENSTVFRFRYITAGTFDAYSWQLLENKQRFISQFMNHTLACRDARDIDETVLTYAEIKALSVGDPLLKTRIDTSNELERVKIHSRQREQELKKMDTVIAETPQILEKLKGQKALLALDLAHALANRESLTKEERNAFGEDQLTRGWLPVEPSQVLQYINSGVSRHTLQIAKLHPCICSWNSLKTLQEILSDEAKREICTSKNIDTLSKEELIPLLNPKFAKYFSYEKDYSYFQKLNYENIEKTADILTNQWHTDQLFDSDESEK